MKIIYVADHLGGGGGEQQFVFIAKNVKAEKLACLTERRGVRAEELEQAVPLRGGFGGRTPLRSVLQLRRLIESFAPDIVHAFFMYSCFLVALSLRLSRHQPVFVCQEFSPPGEILREVALGPLKKSLLRFAYRRADRVVTVSRAVMETFLQDGFLTDPRKGVFIHDGLDLARLDSLPPKETLRETLGLEDDAVHVVFVGSLVERKGVSYLVDAFRGIEDSRLRLLIVGDGPERAALEARAGGDSRVVFLGYRGNGAEYIKASDVFVLPSLYEGLPNVVIEAMAVGTPVVAARVCGVPELIEDRISGLLVSPADAGALGSAIRELTADGTLRRDLSEKSRDRAGYFSLKRMIGDYEKLYASLLARNA